MNDTNLTVAAVVAALNAAGFEARGYGTPHPMHGEKIEVAALVRGERKARTIYLKGNRIWLAAFWPGGLPTALRAIGAQLF